MRVLLHTCCGPCLINPLKALREEGHQVTSFFYNPNIHPSQEYERRLGTLKSYAQEVNVEMVEGPYEVGRFSEEVVFQNKVRCARCYRLRLTESARVAKSQGFAAFSTTLLGSPHQDVALISELGEIIGKKQNTPFLVRNFRSGWQEGVAESKTFGMYRQNYCGCTSSQKDKTLPQKTSGKSRPPEADFGGQGKVESGK